MASVWARSSGAVARVVPKYTPRRALAAVVLAGMAIAYVYVTRVHVFEFEPLPRAVFSPMISARSANFFTPTLTAAALHAHESHSTPLLERVSATRTHLSRMHWSGEDYDQCVQTAINPLFDELTAVATNFHSTGVGGVRHFTDQRRAFATVLVHTLSTVLWERAGAVEAANTAHGRGRAVWLSGKLRSRPRASSVGGHNSSVHQNRAGPKATARTHTRFGATDFKICEMGFGAGHSAALLLSAADCFLHQSVSADSVVATPTSTHSHSVSEDLRVSMVSFDLCRWGFEAEALKLLNRHAFAPHQPLSLISGDATATVPAYLSLQQRQQQLLRADRTGSTGAAHAHAQAFPYAHAPAHVVHTDAHAHTHAHSSSHDPSHSANGRGDGEAEAEEAEDAAGTEEVDPTARAPVASGDPYASWDASENAGKRCDFMLYDVHELGYDGLKLFRSLARRPPPGVSAATPLRTAFGRDMDAATDPLPQAPSGTTRAAASASAAVRVWRPSIIAMDWCVTDRTTELAYQRALTSALPGGGWLREIGCAVDRSNKKAACELKYCFARVYLE